jgi:hypothetical protein
MGGPPAASTSRSAAKTILRLQSVPRRPDALEAWPGADVVEALAAGRRGHAVVGLWDQQLHCHRLALRETDRLREQRLTGLLGAVELRDVDGVLPRVEAHEPQELGLPATGVFVWIVVDDVGLGDPDRPVVDEVPHHVLRRVGDRRHRRGVVLDGVANLHWV